VIKSARRGGGGTKGNSRGRKGNGGLGLRRRRDSRDAGRARPLRMIIIRQRVVRRQIGSNVRGRQTSDNTGYPDIHPDPSQNNHCPSRYPHRQTGHHKDSQYPAQTQHVQTSRPNFHRRLQSTKITGECTCRCRGMECSWHGIGASGRSNNILHTIMLFRVSDKDLRRGYN
jgi:hypothetical protein